MALVGSDVQLSVTNSAHTSRSKADNLTVFICSPFRRLLDGEHCCACGFTSQASYRNGQDKKSRVPIFGRERLAMLPLATRRP